MDEFLKNKIGFTIALLAVLIAMWPLIDDLSFSYKIFSINVSIKDAYFLSVSLLGVAVYATSWQFSSNIRVPYWDKISNFSYVLSLMIPPAYIILFSIIKLVELISYFSDLIPESVLTSISSAIFGALVVFLTNKFSVALQRKDFKIQKESLQEKELDILARVEKLIEEKHYDFSLIEAFKVIELAIRKSEAMYAYNDKIKQSYLLFKKAHDLNLISETTYKNINILRKLKNEAAHSFKSIKKNDADLGLKIASQIVKSLTLTTSANRDFNWLVSHYNEAIKTLRDGEGNLGSVLERVWSAWLRRDGAIGIEIVDFFFLILSNYPSFLLERLSNKPTQLSKFKEYIKNTFFTDYSGEESEVIEAKRMRIINSLESLDKRALNNEEKHTLVEILEVFNKTKVKGID